MSANASHKGAKPADPRAEIIDATMSLAARMRFEEISIRAICEEAHVSLAQFRDAYPSKGAVLAGLSRRLDMIVLAHRAEATAQELAQETAKERLFDVLMRRLDAMAPYKEGLREITAWLRRDPISALAVNRLMLNSMRFMMEAAGVDTGGDGDVIKLQGLALAWARVVGVWLDDEEPELSITLAALDRELTRGEAMVARLDRLETLAAPLKGLAREIFALPRRVAAGWNANAPKREAHSPSHEDGYSTDLTA